MEVSDLGFVGAGVLRGGELGFVGFVIRFVDGFVVVGFAACRV